jgi:L-fuconolactonase
MIVDAHHHLWTADYPWLSDPALHAIQRDYTVSDLRPHLGAAGVHRTVLVEAALCDDAETTSMLALADQTPEIAAVVGWAALSDPALPEKLAAHRAGPGGHLLAGIRDQVQNYAAGDLDRPEVREGLRHVAAADLVNELVVRCDQLPAVARVARDLPESTFVLDHLGKPRVAAGLEGLNEWRERIRLVADCPNVVAKLSGLVTEADWNTWSIKDLAPYAETAMELFGEGRLMFGSDWPVCELAATYEEVVEMFETLLGGRPAGVFGGTAARVYRLEAE